MTLFPRPPRRFLRTGIRESAVQPRRLAGLVTGGAVALSLILGAALPAHADRKDDLARALIGALVVGAIVKGLDDRATPAPAPEPVRSNRVPAVCAISIDGARQSVTLFPESCLRREGLTQRLPRGCANSARIFGREDRVYSAQCLRDAGFRVGVR